MHVYDPQLWQHMFALGLPVLEKILRPVLVYAFLIVGLRLAGKRELAQLNPFDFIVLMTLSNTLQNAIIGDDNSVSGGFIGAATLLAINYGMVRFLYSHRRIDRIVEGGRDFLIKDGKIMKDHLNRELMTRAELTAAAHRQGLGSLADVETAILEPTGTICFIAKKPTPDEFRQEELLKALQNIHSELAALRNGRTAGGNA